MSFRRSIVWLAVLGMMFHAGLIVRHHVTMLDADFLHSSLAADFQVICHGSGGDPSADNSESPPVDSQTKQCPLCIGANSIIAQLPGYNERSWLPSTISMVRLAHTQESYASQAIGFWPPSRGPPLPHRVA